jgi:carbon monoxide dehydrogenase subunit G
MPEIVETIDISGRPQEVFSYVTDFSLFPRWQGGIVSVRRLDDGPLAVGSKAKVIRRFGPRELPGEEEITEMNPPVMSTVRATRGIVTTIARGTIQPLDGGERSRVRIALAFEARGIGKALLPLVMRQARRQLPRNAQRLREVLERAPPRRDP